MSRQDRYDFYIAQRDRSTDPDEARYYNALAMREAKGQVSDLMDDVISRLLGSRPPNVVN